MAQKTYIRYISGGNKREPGHNFIKKITEKAVLFEFSEEWINIYNWQMKGKQFWLPISILYKHKKHIKVIYIPKWASIKIINNRPDEKRIRVYKGAILEDKI